jgi:tripartite-type tricarboxylate transporter receptor subunit TctC
MKAFLLVLCATVTLALAPARAADDYPNKPIRIIVPWPAGGATDHTARLMAAKLTAILEQAVIVENRPGATGVIGTQAVVQAPPDGYTLLFMSASSHSISPNLIKLPFDAINDVTPISLTTIFPFVLAVPANSPYRTVEDLVKAAKANPGKIAYGSSGIGGGAHLVTELFRLRAGIDVLHVPYKGGGSQIIADLISGQIPFMFDSLPSPLGQIRGGRVRALAVTSPERAPAVPNVPALAETIPGFEGVAWTGLGGPARLPKAVVDRLSAAVNKASADPDYAQKVRDLGAVPTSSKTPAEFLAFLLREKERWAKVVADGDIKVAQ